MHIVHMCNFMDGGRKTDAGDRRAITRFHWALRSSNSDLQSQLADYRRRIGDRKSHRDNSGPFYQTCSDIRLRKYSHRGRRFWPCGNRAICWQISICRRDVAAFDVGAGIREILFDLMLMADRPKVIFIVDAAFESGKRPGEIFEIEIGSDRAKEGERFLAAHVSFDQPAQ